MHFTSEKVDVLARHFNLLEGFDPLKDHKCASLFSSNSRRGVASLRSMGPTTIVLNGVMGPLGGVTGEP